MRASASLLSAKTLFALSTLKHIGALASPSINVALEASFSPAPFLVELLETAAEENATAYYPILDQLARGYFDEKDTDKEIYDAFVDLLKNDGHITDPETFASFEFALSVHSAAPRIEAHYQFYRTSVEPSLVAEQKKQCQIWVSFGGKQYCSPHLDEPYGDIESERLDELPFDRIAGNSSGLPSIVYADITSPRFKKFHSTVSRTAKEGKTSYRIRHKPSLKAPKTPLVVNGYGVGLQLKRTDYIVIDDRQTEQTDKVAEQKPLGMELRDDEEVTDLKPLSKDEVSDLGLKAASFVMKSEQPMDTLLKLSQDFPKYSSVIAAQNTSEKFLEEYMMNREQLLPSGSSVIWINGVQIPARDVNPYSLLAHLRRERKLINGVRSQGLSAPDAISLLSHSAITDTQAGDEPQRYDFRDETEGGNVIVWMNNIEKDSRYQQWPNGLRSLLQRTYPGQLPQVRRDIHNAILSVDFTSADDVSTIINTVLGLIKRHISIRWGFVPQTLTAGAVEQAKVIYHLQSTYGLSTVIAYLDASKEAKKLAKPDKAIFDSSVEGAKLRNERQARELADVLKSEDLEERIDRSRRYLGRLAAAGSNAPIFVNGAPIPKGDDWLSPLSQRVSMDLRQIQKGVYEGDILEDSWVPSNFLSRAAAKRNPLIIPEKEKDITLVNMAEFEQNHGESFQKMPRIQAADSASKKDWVHLTIVGDFDSESGLELLTSAVKYREENPNAEIVLVHNPQTGADQTSTAEELLDAYIKSGRKLTTDALLAVLAQKPASSSIPSRSKRFWGAAEPLVEALGFKSGQFGVVINGRKVGPIPMDQIFSKVDMDTLVTYETSRRIQPLNQALEDLELTAKIASPFSLAKIQSLVALSTISDVPEGMFETASTLRMNTFKTWADEHTAIIRGDNRTAIFQVVASIDPATELAQKWIPILKTLSDMKGVHLKLFLNPVQRLQELPVKRFYRYLLDSKPTFKPDGFVGSLEAHFSGIPKEALLNLDMDVPPSWLVAPKESVHDLDNIKLSTLPAGANIDAIYGLESILIEGHSRDTSNSGQPPRGAEIVLATEKDPHFADTIIMANLGYFQFKANPGIYNIQLKSGRSHDIFSLDSAGSQGWVPQPGDETTEIALMSFQGATLFPRLSRKPGQEEADVLVVEESAASELVAKGMQKVNQLLGKMGINFNSEKIFQKGAELLAGNKAGGKKTTQADINIFSVASGHLYERMLNIMMLSVMKHTNHSVKFWFIEQFLSPSFKAFLPTMAAEYNFTYEMVTYKWPHWLRGQTEKQREIWGYKILFLDVLFPLDLHKVIFVDADQIVRTDMHDLVTHDLHGAPYGFTPMGDSRTEMEGFRFWKTGYWANFLRGRPYHISALYVVDLVRFRQLAAGDRLRQQYHSLSADPNSLSNLDQDLPNNMQFNLPIHSLPREWLWCETWCADEDLAEAKTIDLCNNPLTKEPKLERARRQIPEWNLYDGEVAALAGRVRGEGVGGGADVQEEEQVRERERERRGRKDEL
ncbi:glycosyltransferase family 24 protein [Dothidotthia symphoricarpi CBS 119687]|uniref:Glycosyltransferase family 24 protein n=1 Tax=Dothidotthia symphoricarpi CBS 119687 TaxID=1392245 RepID=A0A6A6AS67_9PLEO|nr:glycosyltransferase family 24 protein [Dothidotthia symphoricarpi CBS 119687]KAF2134396.1 glycosyltransferase family 24 protein [Dothidotthia symphoricarpi CBS 119687]